MLLFHELSWRQIARMWIRHSSRVLNESEDVLTSPPAPIPVTGCLSIIAPEAGDWSPGWSSVAHNQTCTPSRTEATMSPALMAIAANHQGLKKIMNKVNDRPPPSIPAKGHHS